MKKNQPRLNLLQQLLNSDDIVKKVVVGVVALSVVAIIANFTAYSTLVSLRYTGNADTNNVDVYSLDSARQQRSKVRKLLGLYMVRRSTQELQIVSGSAETVVNLAAKKLSIGYAGIDINLQNPAAAKLIGAGSQDCYMAAGETAYTYSCNQASALYKLTTNAADQPNAVDLNARFQSSHYRNGLLFLDDVIESNAVRSVSYQEPGKQLIRRNLPVGFYGANDYVVIVTDQTNPRSTGFVVYNYDSGVGYYYKGISDSSAPRQFKRQHKLNANSEQSACVLVGSVLSCYHGYPGRETHHDIAAQAETDKIVNKQDRGEEKELPKRGVIEVMDFGQGNSATRTYNGPENYGAMELFSTADGTLYGKSELSLSRLELKKSSFTSRTLSNDVWSASAAGNLYYVASNKLYRYNQADSTTQMIYQKTAVTLDTVQAYGDSVLFAGRDNKDPLQLLRVYQTNN